MVVGVSLLTAATALRAPADQPATATKHETTFTGTVVSVDPKENVLNVKEFLLSKRFNLGDACTYTFVGKASGAVADLRPGQKVAVSYENAHGVLVADRVVQKPLRHEGMVKAIGLDKQAITLHLRALDKTFQLADDCKVVLRGNRTGSLADVQPGNHVTVLYETPNGTPTARLIEQTSESFTGTLTAIDLSERTVKAKSTFDTKRFNLADGCAIVINGKTDGQMRDLKPGGRLTFSYDAVNGVNVVNRIAAGGVPSETVTASSTR